MDMQNVEKYPLLRTKYKFEYSFAIEPYLNVLNKS